MLAFQLAAPLYLLLASGWAATASGKEVPAGLITITEAGQRCQNDQHCQTGVPALFPSFPYPPTIWLLSLQNNPAMPPLNSDFPGQQLGPLPETVAVWK
jgi:hypothetical protein